LREINFFLSLQRHDTEQEVETQKESLDNVQKELDELNRNVENFNKENEVRVAELGLKKK
jgi:hypothetical protein